MTDNKKHWFETLPALLAGIVAVIGAIASLYVAISDRNESKSVLENQPVLNVEPHTAYAPSLTSQENRFNTANIPHLSSKLPMQLI